jgi:YrbI family 3-deoxy-D-manno-octulosonate 8-phosphate phosphatase
MHSGEAMVVIPARGGSRGIPGKNIRPLCGRPLIAWAIATALSACGVRRVIVSTDDAEIANVSREAGAEVVERPAELATDDSPSESALLHVLDTVERRGEAVPDLLVFLQCTAPLTTVEDIEGTLAMVSREGYDSAFAVAPFHGVLWRRGEGGPEGVNHDPTRRLMRQDRAGQFEEMGSVYAMRAGGFRAAGFRFFGRIGMYETSHSRTYDIDEPDDWAVAEMLKARQVETAQRRALPWEHARALVTDFDGVLTDNRVCVDERGVESVLCNRSDGWGIGLLRRHGIQVACVSTEQNPVVLRRCDKLNVACWNDQRDKVGCAEEFLRRCGLGWDECVYVGNDTNDLDCLRRAAIGVAPADAVPEVLLEADHVTHARGGEGVIRELASLVAEARKGCADNGLLHPDR